MSEIAGYEILESATAGGSTLVVIRCPRCGGSASGKADAYFGEAVAVARLVAAAHEAYGCPDAACGGVDQLFASLPSGRGPEPEPEPRP